MATQTRTVRRPGGPGAAWRTRRRMSWRSPMRRASSGSASSAAPADPAADRTRWPAPPCSRARCSARPACRDWLPRGAPACPALPGWPGWTPTAPGSWTGPTQARPSWSASCRVGEELNEADRGFLERPEAMEAFRKIIPEQAAHGVWAARRPGDRDRGQYGRAALGHRPGRGLTSGGCLRAGRAAGGQRAASGRRPERETAGRDGRTRPGIVQNSRARLTRPGPAR